MAAPRPRSSARTFEDVARVYVDRRQFLRGGVAGLALAWARPVLAWPDEPTRPSIAHDAGSELKVAPGYAWSRVVSWGDPVVEGAEAFDPTAQTPASQAKQFGYNNDYTAYFPLEGSSSHGVLVVNHEYTNPELMFADWPGREAAPRPEHVAVELEAHGLSVVEVRREESGAWSVVYPSALNRRITGWTAMEVRGPAAGHAWLRTGDDPEGRTALGTFNNCGGGVTPWGTVLTCEENIDQYFSGDVGALEEPLRGLHQRYTVAGISRRWGESVPRFDVASEPHEPCRFGWVVEFDPRDPASVPKKRTALGRFKHEACATVLADDGRAVLYSGDDARFEYLYKFVSEGRYDPSTPGSADGLLDAGTLHVAKFEDDGTGRWIPLVWGEGPLTPEHGFPDAGSVVINARGAGDAVGATPMDRPEDVEICPVTGRLYCALTNNSRRTEEQRNGPNPRAANHHGQILELSPDEGDHTGGTFRWELLILGGDPATESGARYHAESPTFLSCPDNLAFSQDGRLFVATDGQNYTLQVNDGLYAVDTRGTHRGKVRQLLSAVPGAEVTGPSLTPDGRTMFVSIQHPAEGSTFNAPSIRFPDADASLPPRPTVVALFRPDGEPVG